MSEATPAAPAAAPAAPAAAAATPALPAGAANTPPAGAASGDWTTGFNDDLKGYVQTKGFKDPASVIDSYKNLEKLMGAPKERLLRIPDNMDDQTAMGELYTKLGRPATANEYKIEIPKEAGGEAIAGFMKNSFHEAGLTPKQAAVIASKWTQTQAAAQKEFVEKQTAEFTKQADGLKKEWGAAYDNHVAVAKKAAREFGVAPETIDKMESAMGFSNVVKFFHTIGSKMGEADFVSTSSGNSFAMTPEAARTKIASLRLDTEFTKRLTNGDIGAKAEWERAHKMAYPE